MKLLLLNLYILQQYLALEEIKEKNNLQATPPELGATIGKKMEHLSPHMQNYMDRYVVTPVN